MHMCGCSLHHRGRPPQRAGLCYMDMDTWTWDMDMDMDMGMEDGMDGMDLSLIHI